MKFDVPCFRSLYSKSIQDNTKLEYRKLVSRQITKIINSSNLVYLLNNLQIHVNASMLHTLHRNQRAFRVPATFMRSQTKVPHKTLKYIIFQNFNPHFVQNSFF